METSVQQQPIMAMADVAESNSNSLKKQLALVSSSPVSAGHNIKPNNPLVLFRLVLLVYHLAQWFRVVSTVGTSGEEEHHEEPLD